MAEFLVEINDEIGYTKDVFQAVDLPDAIVAAFTAKDGQMSDLVRATFVFENDATYSVERAD